MGKLVLSYSMSLDGFIAGPDISVDQPMGNGGERLHDWMFKSTSTVDKEMAGEASPGAVIVGRRTFDVGLGPWGDTPFPAPTFVITRQKREPLAMQSGHLYLRHRRHRKRAPPGPLRRSRQGYPRHGRRRCSAVSEGRPCRRDHHPACADPDGSRHPPV